MSTFCIRAVHLESSASGTHQHIARVRISESDSTDGISVATIAADIRDPNGDRYYTYGGGERADVLVRSCPVCSFRDYITTHPDSTTKNNLLSLPRY
jgi:hypothetical protein